MTEELSPYKKCLICESAMQPQWIPSLSIHKSYCTNYMCTMHCVMLSDEEYQKLSPSPWIPCKDRLPEASKVVMFVCKRHSEICIGYKCFDDPSYTEWIDMLNTDGDGDYADEYNVTHWMPLPGPPPDKDEA